MMVRSLLLLPVFFTFFTFLAHGQEDEALTAKKSNYQINDDFKSGSGLIYDCARGYYVCVDEDDYKKCEIKRTEAIEMKLAAYPCAPLKKYLTKAECGRKNYEVVEALAKKRFCYQKK